MIPYMYLELSRPHDWSLRHRVGDFSPTPVHWISRNIQILHGASSKNNIPFAVSFSDYKKGNFRTFGRGIRIFSDSQENLEKILNEIKIDNNEWFFQENQISSVIKVEDRFFHGACESFQRIRFPNKNKFKDKSIWRQRVSEIEKLPTLTIRMNGSGKSKRLSFPVLREIHEANAEKLVKNDNPTSYGFSKKGSLVLLPIVPWKKGD